MYIAHKSKSAGQVVYTDPKVQSLSNYIKAVRMEEQTEKKLTFDEWYKDNAPGRFWTGKDFEDYLNMVWNAALEKGKGK